MKIVEKWFNEIVKNLLVRAFLIISKENAKKAFFAVCYNLLALNYQDYSQFLNEFLEVKPEETRKNVIYFKRIHRLFFSKDISELKRIKYSESL